MRIFLFLILVYFLPFMAFAGENESAYDHVISKNEVICGMMAWAPYASIDPNTKEWQGVTVDIMRRAFATLDLKVTFKEVIPGNQVQDLNSGRIDAVCGDGPWILSAGKFLDYSDPFYASIVYPYVRKDDNRFKTRADLNKSDVQFAGIDADLSIDLVQRLFPAAKFSSKPATTDVSQLLLDVTTQKADVAIVDPNVFAEFDAHNPGKIKQLFGKPLGHYKGVISVKKGDFKMWSLANQAIDNALAFGIVDDVLDGFDPQHNKIMRIRSPYTF